ncbi:MAG TPA: Ger(x)C family spore germination protein [Clostridia bacterium]|nr:Ger(x)C family spore germination protein [Clostridia bacterium]
MPEGKKIKIIILWLILFSLCLCGCWDMIELEERAFILGAGVDKTAEGMFSITYQIALPDKMSGGEDGGNGGDGTINITVEGETLYDARNKLITMVDRVPNFEHLQVLLIGEEIARDGLQEFVDILARNYQMRRRTKVFVAKGKAEEILKTKAKIEKSTALYLSMLPQNNGKINEQITATVDLGTMIENLRADFDFMLGVVQLEEEEISLSGAAVFNGGKLVGYLFGDSLAGAQWLKGDIKSSRVIVDKPTGELNKAVCLMGNVKTKLIPFINGNKIDFKLELITEGELLEIYPANQIIFTEEQITGIEKAIETKIISLCRESLRVLQEEMRTDVLMFEEHVRNKKYNFWEENRQDWDRLFSQAQIDLEVRARIRRVGLTR